MMEAVVTSGKYIDVESCSQIVTSPPTNQHRTFYRPDALPVAQQTVSEH